MNKKIFLSSAFILFSSCVFAQGFAQNANTNIFPPVGTSGSMTGELSLYGGVSASKSEADIFDQTLDFGGSGAVLGVTALGYVTPQIALGVDISYADNGSGTSVKHLLGDYTLATQHIVPMFFAKIHLLPAQGRFRLYIPLGIGVDITSADLEINEVKDSSRTQTGLALAGGLGAEVVFNNGSFAGIEGRYNYANYFGDKFDGISDCGVINILFKVGVRFDGDAFLN